MRGSAESLREEGALVLTFVVLAVALTWPLGDLTNLRLPDIDDAMFSVWRIAWIAHQLPSSPRSLFDANIFWPEKNTLAFSDAMLLPGIAATPLIRAGIHPVAVHNLLLIASFVFAAYGASRLCRHFTPSRPAMAIAGVIFAFAPYRFAHIGHLELLWSGFVPLALLALYRGLEHPSVRGAVGAGLLLGMQGLASLYYFAFATLWITVAVAVSRLHVQWRPRLPHLGALALVIATVLLVLSPYLLPYSRARATFGARSDADVQRYSAEPADYLRVPTEHKTYPSEWRDAREERSLFVGFTALTLALVAVVRVRNGAALAFATLAVVAFDLSLGVNGFLFPPLRAVLTPLSAFRAPARFSMLFLLAISILAGIGTSKLVAALTTRRRVLVTALLLGALLLEYWSVPVTTRAVPLMPPQFHRWLASQPRTVTLELPVPEPHALWRFELTYQYLSIFHWQPLVNGYSGFMPSSYADVLARMQDFPSPVSLRFLKNGGADLVVLHEQYLGTARFEALLHLCADTTTFAEMVLFQEETERIAGCRVRR